MSESKPIKPSPVLDGYLTRAELSREIGISVRTLERWAVQRIGPPIAKCGRRPLYSVSSVRAWLASSEQQMVRERGRRRAAA